MLVVAFQCVMIFCTNLTNLFTSVSPYLNCTPSLYPFNVLKVKENQSIHQILNHTLILFLAPFFMMKDLMMYNFQMCYIPISGFLGRTP